MKKMLIDHLDPMIKQAICDRLSSEELVDLLQVPIEEILDLLEDKVIENLSDVLEFAQIDNPSYEEEDTY